MVLAAPFAVAGGGPLGIDHRWQYDESGIWNRNLQLAMIGGLLGAEAAGALWEGGDSRLGHTLWTSIDATALTGLSVYAMKYAFSRVRPSGTANPDEWFKGRGNSSFPSGEVSMTSAIVTPIILEYGPDHPWSYALELLPVYDSFARLKVQGHWQTDVLAGYAIGTAAGYFVHQRTGLPFVLSAMPHGVYVGIGKRW